MTSMNGGGAVVGFLAAGSGVVVVGGLVVVDVVVLCLVVGVPYRALCNRIILNIMPLLSKQLNIHFIFCYPISINDPYLHHSQFQ